MARRVVRTALRQGQRRANTWTSSADVSAVTTLAAGVKALDQTFSEASLLSIGMSPCTIVRTRGVLLIKSDQDAANEDVFGSIGFAVVSEQARVIGGTAIPGPTRDAPSDLFFVHQFWGAGNSGPSTGALFGVPWYRYEFDSKAMRKVAPGDSIVVMIENGHATAGAAYLMQFRMLLKGGAGG